MTIQTPPTQPEQKTNGHNTTPVPTAQAEGPLWLCDVTREPVTPTACFACSRNGRPNACSFTPPILEALRSSMRSDDGLRAAYNLAAQQDKTVLRVSSLTGCTRQAWYKLTQGTPLETPSRHWARLRGTIFHKALESMAEKSALAEYRLLVDLSPWGVPVIIAGMVDHYDPATGVLTDLKTINTWKRLSKMEDLPYQHHVAQLWMYAWLLEKDGAGYPERMQITYMTMGDIRTVPVDLPDEKAKKAVETRLIAKAKAIVEANDDGPEGDPRKDWQCRYCLYKVACPYRRDTKK